MIGRISVQFSNESWTQAILHFAPPAIISTTGLVLVLIFTWLFIYWILIGAIPLPQFVRETIRLNLATVKDVPGLNWFLQPLFSRLREREQVRTRRQQHAEADQIIDDCEQILSDDFQFDVSFDGDRESIRTNIVNDTEQTKTGAYPLIISTLLDEYSKEQRNGIEALVFAREIEKSRASENRRSFTGEQISDFTRGVHQALSIFNFHDPGDNEEQFLLLYENLRAAIRGEAEGKSSQESGTQSSTSLAKHQAPSQEYLIELYRDFMTKYYPSEKWVKFAEDDYIEYKNKIVELVQSQISIGGIQSDIFDILKEERKRIREQLEAQEAYLVCSKEIADYDGSIQYDALPDKYPRSIRIGHKYIEEPGRDEEELKIKMRIVFPRQSYGTAENFIRNSLSDIVPDEELVFVSKLSMPFEHDRNEQEFYEIADDVDNVNYVLSTTDFLLHGRSEEEITRAAIDNLRTAEMDVAKLLKSLTLRSIVKGATYEEEKFFSEHKPRIEDGLNIRTIFEWGEQDPEVIGELLQRWDDENVSNRWREIAGEYISQISAATPPGNFHRTKLDRPGTQTS